MKLGSRSNVFAYFCKFFLAKKENLKKRCGKMHFTLSEHNIRQLAETNSFEVPDDGMVFIGSRGSLPLYDENHEFQKEHQITLQDINYLNPRCTIGQWIPRNEQFALFPGKERSRRKSADDWFLR